MGDGLWEVENFKIMSNFLLKESILLLTLSRSGPKSPYGDIRHNRVSLVNYNSNKDHIFNTNKKHDFKNIGIFSFRKKNKIRF